MDEERKHTLTSQRAQGSYKRGSTHLDELAFVLKFIDIDCNNTTTLPELNWGGSKKTEHGGVYPYFSRIISLTILQVNSEEEMYARCW